MARDHIFVFNNLISIICCDDERCEASGICCLSCPFSCYCIDTSDKPRSLASLIRTTLQKHTSKSISCDTKFLIQAPHHESGMGGSNVGSSSASAASLLPPGSSGSQALERIPERRFRLLTISLVAGSLGVAFALPDIELVLGLVGSSIGTITCLLLPALCFLKVAPSHPYHHSRWGGGKGVTAERLLAQVMIIVGTTILILSTYANLHAVDQAHTDEVITPLSIHESGVPMPKLPAALVPAQPVGGGKVAAPVAIPQSIPGIDVPKKVDLPIIPAGKVENLLISNIKDGSIVKITNDVVDKLKPDKRQEPPVPVAPDSKVKKKQREDKETEKKEIETKEEEAPVPPPTKKAAEDKVISKGEGEMQLAAAKEPSDAHDTIHGDAIKKEEEEVGIEEGAAKREKDRIEEEEKKEKERKEKELLEKLADDRKKQQELIDVQMEILKKLEALEGKKVENEASNGKKDSNVEGTSQVKKSEDKVPGREAVKKVDDLYAARSKEDVKEKPRHEVVSNSSLKESKKSVEIKNKLAIQSQNEAQPKTGNVEDIKNAKPKVLEKVANFEKKPLKGESKLANVSFGDLSQMKAAVPMPLLHVGGQQNGIMEDKSRKAKDREKREALEEFDELNIVQINKSEVSDKQDKEDVGIFTKAENLVNLKGEINEKPSVINKIKMPNLQRESTENANRDSKPDDNISKTNPDEIERKDSSSKFRTSNQDVLPLKVGPLSINPEESFEKHLVKEKDSVNSKPCPVGKKDDGKYISPTIQIPARLSNPTDGNLVPENVDCNVNLDGIVMESMPLKRDLKFVDEVADEDKQKNRGLP